jgi:excisionase family DNA binding protein
MERIVDETVDVTEKIHATIEKKMNLTIKEAAEYSNIGINKIAEMLRNPMCNFVLYIGNKKLVKRKEFEQYLSTVREI